MILHMYAMKNRLSGIFEKPFLEPYAPDEYPDLLRQSLAVAPVDALRLHREFDVYYLGRFESKTAVIELTGVEFVESLEQVCDVYILAKEAKANVEESRESA